MMPQEHQASYIHVYTWLARHKITVLLLAVVILAASLWLGSRACIDTSSLAFFPDTDAEIVRMAEAMSVAPFSRLLLIHLTVHNTGEEVHLAAIAQQILEALPRDAVHHVSTEYMPEPRAFMRLLPALFDEDMQNTLQILLSPEYIHTAMQANQQVLGQLWGQAALGWIQADPLHFRAALISRIPQPVYSGGGIQYNTGFPLSADGKHLLIILQPTHALHDVPHAIALMDAVTHALRNIPPDITATVVGGHKHTALNAQTIENDIQRVLLFTLVGFVGIYIFLVRSWSGALWLFATPVAAGAVAMGAVSLIWPVVSGLALGFGASILGVADDYAVHVHFALRAARAEHRPYERTMQLITSPLVQGCLVNATGFAVLLFSGIPAIRQLAAFALIMLATGLVCALVVLPLLPCIAIPPLKYKSIAHQPRRPHAGRVALCASIFLSISILCGQYMRFDISPRSLGAFVADMQADGHNIQAVWGKGAERVWVVTGKDVDTSLANTRAWVDILHTHNVQTSSFVSLLPSPTHMQANIHRWQDFVAQHPYLEKELTRAAAEQGFAPHAFMPFIELWNTTPTPLTPEIFTAMGLEHIRTLFLVQNTNSRALSIILEQNPAPIPVPVPAFLQDVVLSLTPNDLEASLLHHLAREKWLLPAAMGIYMLILLLCFRHIPRALFAALPSLAALAAICLWHTLTHRPLTLAALAALPLVVGLAIDHGIFVVHDITHGVHLATHKAIMVSSLTALMGMGVLAFAQHPVLQSMGQIIFVGLLVEMCVALWLLPKLCTKADAL